MTGKADRERECLLYVVFSFFLECWTCSQGVNPSILSPCSFKALNLLQPQILSISL